eukprot:TRINITY_DN13278_c0_g1_i1.p1 TRINITY_DN13278_c0_g1~~TRINITY_DN13278_c0_g1_i1.p1  ORF type:complete len:301 (+),score=72.39 TRINITY_DN13278_c0_g1_i1:33-935(+)
MARKRTNNTDEKKNGKGKKPVQAIQKSTSPATPAQKRAVYTNKQRVLVFSSRGVTYRDRHMLQDIRTLLPHHKTDSKRDDKKDLRQINEICELKNCNGCMYFEARKHKDIYLWMASPPHGPSVKFLIRNVHTMDELNLTGNSLMGSRPFLSFDSTFDDEPRWKLLKEMLSQIFGTPRGHPKSKPFIDHVFTFSVVDNKIWFRNFQIVDVARSKKVDETQLVEIGPRFVMDVIRIFGGSFGGETLYQSPTYVSPNATRALGKRDPKATRYQDRVAGKKQTKDRKLAAFALPEDEVEDLYRS